MFSEMNVSSKTHRFVAPALMCMHADTFVCNCTHVFNNRSKRLLKTAPALPLHIAAYLQPQESKVVGDGQGAQVFNPINEANATNSKDACFNVLAPTGAHEAGYAAQKVAELQQQLAVVTRELQVERARQAVTTQVSISLCYARPTR